MQRLLLPFLLILAACTLALPDRKPDTPAAITPGTVTVTPLPEATSPAGAPGAAPSAAPAPSTPPQPRPAPAPTPVPAAPTAAAPAETTGPAPEPTPPPAPLSPAQAACLKKGGTWSATGLAKLETCLFPTRDAGKSCRRASDCEGLCLARSRTCAPIKPLFGCNPILQEDGTEATLCID